MSGVTDFLAATRASYDALAAAHVDLVSTDLTGRPLDRAMITAFAGYVRATGDPRVADVGCGAGRVTPVLAELGLDPRGVDLSPAMIALARAAHPDLRFDVGSMLDLDLPDGGLGGVLAHYSIIHVPWELRPRALAEFHRVLRPGGWLMLTFQVGSDRRHYAEVDGLAIALDFHRQQPGELAGLLRDAGFRPHATLVRDPETTDLQQQGCILAVKPG